MNDPELSRDVALKVPRMDALVTPELRERFRTEARAAAGLDHPNVVPVYEAGEVGPVCYIASAYCPGPTLAEWLRRRSDPVPCPAAALLTAALADGVQHAHERGVLHRDLKPANVLLQNDELRTMNDERRSADSNFIVPRITDFGLARLGEPVVARPVGPLGRGWRWCRRNPAVASLLTALAVAVVSGFAGVTGKWLEADRERSAAVNARQREEAERKSKEAALRQTEASSYRLAIALAQREWLTNSVGRAEQFLEESCPDPLREWEWRYLKRLCHTDHLTLRRLSDTGNVAFSSEGRRLAAADGDRRVTLWDAQTGKPLLHLADHHAGAQQAFSPDGRLLASADSARGVTLWDAVTGERLGGLAGLPWPGALAFSPDGQLLAAANQPRRGGAPSQVKVWNVATHREVASIDPRDVSVGALAFSPDGACLATAGESVVRLWDVATGRPLPPFVGHEGSVWSVAFSPDGKRMASASQDRTVRLWDRATGQTVRTYHGHTDVVTSVAFHPDGRSLASASFDQTVRVWDGTGLQEQLIHRGHAGAVTVVAVSPDGRYLASGSGDRTVKVWDVTTGQEVVTLRGHTDYILCVTFSPDGRRVASAAADRTVRAWGLGEGEAPLILHSEVGSVAFHPDGRRLATGGLDQTVKVWDAVGGHEVLTLKGHTAVVRGVAFSSDGRRLASVSLDGTLRLWDASPLAR